MEHLVFLFAAVRLELLMIKFHKIAKTALFNVLNVLIHLLIAFNASEIEVKVLVHLELHFALALRENLTTK
jgi:hypothetical protein